MLWMLQGKILEAAGWIVDDDHCCCNEPAFVGCCEHSLVPSSMTMRFTAGGGPVDYINVSDIHNLTYTYIQNSVSNPHNVFTINGYTALLDVTISCGGLTPELAEHWGGRIIFNLSSGYQANARIRRVVAVVCNPFSVEIEWEFYDAGGGISLPDLCPDMCGPFTTIIS